MRPWGFLSSNFYLSIKEFKYSIILLPILTVLAFISLLPHLLLAAIVLFSGISLLTSNSFLSLKSLFDAEWFILSKRSVPFPIL